MLNILIVEDDTLLATILKDMIESEQRHRVVKIAAGSGDALAYMKRHRPDLALIDIHLSGNATGVEVAALARDIGVPALFTTANPLPFPVAELALGCLCKPYSCYSVTQSLRIAEQIIRRSERTIDPPSDLELY